MGPLNGRFNFPTSTILLPDILIRLGAVCRFESRTIPIKLLTRSVGNVSEQDGLSERSRIIKVAGSWRSIFARFNPLRMMPD